MNKTDIITLLSDGEGEMLEFKTSFGKEAIETISAFANSSGGSIFVGVNNNGNIRGVDVNNETAQNYINQIKNSIEPSLIVDIEKVVIDDKIILVIEVDEFPIKPVSFKGKYLKRIGNSNHQLSPTEISNMYLQSLQLSWDAYDSKDIIYKDLDVSKIDNYFTRVNESERFRLGDDRIQNLQKLNLLNELKPTNAATLLFGRDLKH